MATTIDQREWEWERRKFLALMLLTAVGLVLGLFLIIAPVEVYAARQASEFSLQLTSFNGLTDNLNATTTTTAADTATTTVSPVFDIKMQINNSHVVLPWCYNGGEVVVSYSDVALAWCPVPRFCINKGVPTQLRMMPWGRAVGLPHDLRRRLALDCQQGTAQVMVDVMLFPDGTARTNYPEPLFRQFKLKLN
ncbi:hypothetical protein BS78_03G156400 [Paspalum vaginatum]|nr:hypothetical protein BS78_03G156400 [Paspalum vaginatum]